MRRIEELRILNDQDRTQMAHFVGCNQSTYSKIERGKLDITTEQSARLLYKHLITEKELAELVMDYL